MNARILVGCLLVSALLVFGCSQEQIVQPDRTQVGGTSGTDNSVVRENAPPQYYSFYTEISSPDPNEWKVFRELELIDTVSGAGTYIWTLGVDNDVPSLENPTGKGVAVPLGLTFDVDGTMYTIVNWLGGAPGSGNPLSELGVVDIETGAVDLIGAYPIHYGGAEIDACGNLYAVGFSASDPAGTPTYFGDGKLYRFDKITGVAEAVGETTGIPDVMDLAFDSQGTLWATTDNKLYTISTESGAATFITDIIGVPSGPPGPDEGRMGVMSIMFDKHDNLYASATIGFAADWSQSSPVMRIDVETGNATVIGRTNTGYCHGGDNMPSKVRVCHVDQHGDYVTIMVNLNSLPAHLAHGDVVPGTSGYDCECPEVAGMDRTGY